MTANWREILRRSRVRKQPRLADTYVKECYTIEEKVW